MTQTSCLLRAVATVALLAVPAAAPAQQPPAPTTQTGPMIVEQVHQRFSISPEYKVSKFDDATAQFAGVQGSVFLTGSIAIGGGFYTLTNGTKGRGMTYGGATIGWQPLTGGPFGLDLHGLIGMGQGTTTDTVTLTRFRNQPITVTQRLSSDFLVAEPQADLLVRLTKHLNLSIGGGYRFAGHTDLDRDRFSGATGTIGLQLGSSK